MKKLLLLFAIFLSGQHLFGQGVGINTLTPDPGAALDIRSPSGSNKGVLIPKVNLTSLTDNTTIPNPTIGLLIWNTNTNLPSGSGFYYNHNAAFGTANWINLSKQFVLPYYNSSPSNATLFRIDSYSQSPTSIAIDGSHFGPGTGVRAFSSSGLGLDVAGGVKISGNGQSPGVGKVLTSDATGNATWQAAQPQISFRAHGVKGGGSEIIAKQVPSKIPFATEDNDLGNNYNDANTSPHSTFTAPVNGIYHFDALVSWKSGGQGISQNVHLSLNRIRNNSTSEIISSESNVANANSDNISIDVKLQQGDQIFVSVYALVQDYLTLWIESEKSNFNGRLVIKQ